MFGSQASVEGRVSTVQSTSGRLHVFKRRQTIATLSTVVDERAGESPSSPADKSPTCGHRVTLSSHSSVEDTRRSRGSLRHQQRIRSPTKTATSVAAIQDIDSSGVAAATQRAGKRQNLQNRLSTEGSQISACFSNSLSQPQQPHRKLGRTPSSPSVLFTRVKERIREKVSIVPKYKIAISRLSYMRG
jgi:hypothetical protein